MLKIFRKISLRSPRARLTIFVGLVLSCIPATVFLIFWYERDTREWDLRGISEYIGTEYPDDARVIENKSRVFPRYIALDVTFETLPESVSKFTSGICGGTLHAGYDPFQAINIHAPLHDTHLIKASTFAYYSYSPDVPDTLLGNRCRGIYGHIQQISVDTTNPQHYLVRFEQPADCGAAVLPCFGEYTSKINPIPELPFIVIGLDENYQLIGDEFCLEARGSFVNANPPEYDYLIGAAVNVAIDNQPMPPAHISKYWVLMPDSARNSSNDILFNHCFLQNWSSGAHTVTINVVPVDGNPSSFSWEFFVD